MSEEPSADSEGFLRTGHPPGSWRVGGGRTGHPDAAGAVEVAETAAEAAEEAESAQNQPMTNGIVAMRWVYVRVHGCAGASESEQNEK